MAASGYAAVTLPSLHVDAHMQRDEFMLRAAIELAPGQVLGVVGPNGAGKTTLLRAIAGLTPVTGGVITLGDDILDDAGSDTFVRPEQRPVSFVFQDYRLFPHLSVADNVAFPLRSRGVKRAVART